MGRKARFVALMLAGLGLAALSVLADVVGIGGGDYVFGWEQMLGVAAGTTLVWVAAMRLAGFTPGRSRQGARQDAGQDAQHAAPVSA